MVILEFERRLNRAGEPRDWVHFAASIPESVLASTWARVSEFQPTPEDEVADNDGAKLKRAIWHKTVGPAYEAWKSGTEMPETGTPISAWLELGRHQQKALQTAGISTVEQIAEMTESAMAQIPLLDKHSLKRSARMFLDALASRGNAEKAAAQDAELAALRAELEALKAESKPRRGRPPKKATEEISDEDPGEEAA